MSRRHSFPPDGANVNGASPRSTRSEAGDTLIEVLLALVVLALASVALILAFSTSISASADHRRLATANIVLDSTSQELISAIQSNLTYFTSCSLWTAPNTPTTYFESSLDPNLLVEPTSYESTPKGPYTATIEQVMYWDNVTSSPQYGTFTSTCAIDVPEQITLEVTDPNGHVYTNTFVVDYPLSQRVRSQRRRTRQNPCLGDGHAVHVGQFGYCVLHPARD